MKWSGLCGSELVNLHESVHGFISWEVGNTEGQTINREEDNIWEEVNRRQQDQTGYLSRFQFNVGTSTIYSAS